MSQEATPDCWEHRLQFGFKQPCLRFAAKETTPNSFYPQSQEMSFVRATEKQPGQQLSPPAYPALPKFMSAVSPPTATTML